MTAQLCVAMAPCSLGVPGCWIVVNHHVAGWGQGGYTEDCKEIDTCMYDSDPNNRPVQLGVVVTSLHPLVVHILTAVPLR